MRSPHNIHFSHNSRVFTFAVKRKLMLLDLTQHTSIMRPSSLNQLDQLVQLLTVTLTAFKVLLFHVH